MFFSPPPIAYIGNVALRICGHKYHLLNVKEMENGIASQYRVTFVHLHIPSHDSESPPSLLCTIQSAASFVSPPLPSTCCTFLSPSSPPPPSQAALQQECRPPPRSGAPSLCFTIYRVGPSPAACPSPSHIL
jgi:hypothetical protein